MGLGVGRFLGWKFVSRAGCDCELDRGRERGNLDAISVDALRDAVGLAAGSACLGIIRKGIMGLAFGNRIYRLKNHGVECYFGNYWILGMIRTFGLFMSEVTRRENGV